MGCGDLVFGGEGRGPAGIARRDRRDLDLGHRSGRLDQRRRGDPRGTEHADP
jgi:hypothetical protein